MRLSRRGLLAAAPLAAAAVGLASCAEGDGGEHLPGLLARGPQLWNVPHAAWLRSLGSHPPGALPLTQHHAVARLPVGRTKRGIPVGGIGTGACMYNLAGSFGPWHLDIGGDDSLGSHWGSLRNSGFEQRFLSQAAFHVRLATSVGIVTRALATEDLLPAWTMLQPGQGVYAALFPKAWFSYDALPLSVALKQLTPYVARDERRSSLPGGVFRLAVANPTDAPAQVSCMFSFPNAPFRAHPGQYAYTRQGLRSSRVAAPGVVGVRLQADDPANVAETQRTEWVIAAHGPAGSQLSATEDWAADGDGADLWEAFSTGALPDRPVDRRRRGLAGAVCVSFELAPGERKVATFALAWDFPVVQFRNPVDGTEWWKRYTQWFPGPYRGWAVAHELVTGATALEQAIDAWWSKVAEDDAYPLWLRCAALNELYYDVFGGVFWENGCITKPKVYGNRPGQHLYFTLECDALRDCESLDVRHYETRHLLELFPTIERDVLLGWGDMILADALGRTPHDAGSPVDDPWFVVGQYAATQPGAPPVGVDWLDLPAKFVQQSHAYWRYTGDDTFAEEIYPSLQRAMAHLLGHDADHDGIPDAAGFCTTYDAITMTGAATYVAALTVGACEAMADFAGLLDTQDAVEAWSAAAAQARATAEAVLWVPSAGYYRLDSGGPYSAALMADALCGQLYAGRDGLDDVLDTANMASHLLQVYRHNVLAAGNGQYGAVNAVDVPGGPIDTFQGRVVWPGGSYFTAALMYRLGTATHNDALLDAALTTGFGVYRTTYEDDGTAFWFDTPAVWLAADPTRYRSGAYQRARAAWELLVALKDPFPPRRRPQAG